MKGVSNFHKFEMILTKMKKIVIILIALAVVTACNKTSKCKSVNLSGLHILNEYVVALDKAKTENKPILVYFSAFANVNSRVFEDKILTNSCVQKKINDEFIFVQLYTDDKTSKGQEDKVKDLYFKFIGPAHSPSFAPIWAVIDQHERLFKIIEPEELQLLALKNHHHPSLAESESNKFISYLDKTLEAIKNNDTIILPVNPPQVNKAFIDYDNKGNIVTSTDYGNYDDVPAERQIFSFDFSYKKTGGKDETGYLIDLIIKISNPKGADLLAPEQESDLFIPLQINMAGQIAEKNGDLKFPTPDQRNEDALDETLMYYDDKTVILKQPLKLNGRLPLRIKGEIVFSWIYKESITVPVAKTFELVITD